jgi:predicted O-methyltransferase YrrM
MNFAKIDELAMKSNVISEDTTTDFLEQLQEFHLGPNGKHNYYRFLYQIVMEFQPKMSLEIGIDHALGSAYMCEAASNYSGEVIGIDIRDCLKYVNSNFIFLHGDSQKAESEFAKIVNKGDLGLVFQDSSHHYNASCNEWNIYSKYLAEGAIWICDDITPTFYNTDVDPPGKGMIEYFNALPGSKKLYKDVLHYGNTIGVVLC